jgi:hypothetical protein
VVVTLDVLVVLIVMVVVVFVVYTELVVVDAVMVSVGPYSLDVVEVSEVVLVVLVP